jgi:hypothetical protein
VSTVDRHRQRVYDAEEAAFGGTLLSEPMEWDDLLVLAHSVVHNPWWAGLEVDPPTIRAARADSGRSSSDGSTIRLASGGRTALTVSHELAHHLVAALEPDDPGHGPAFRAAALRTMALVGGTDARHLLDEEWRRWGVPAGTWRWPEPPLGPGHLVRGAIAL